MSQTKSDFALSLIDRVKLAQADLDAAARCMETAQDELEAAETKLNALLDVIEAAAYPVADHARPT
ncbi:hypothetical protein [uncultured Lamprocystis sp.]|jgi:hypothetical protein|uniref:hypothetical protein n=1 Tax=uncultured Lamprocystis sp. TaxID=543132 RepID=UPI0025FD5214|nr:hypothetical protein [uncultured Lamprocystis sp.]